MFELRWVRRKIENPRNHLEEQYDVRVLQYRIKEPEDIPEFKRISWSDWIDVPEVTDEN